MENHPAIQGGLFYEYYPLLLDGCYNMFVRIKDLGLGLGFRNIYNYREQYNFFWR